MPAKFHIAKIADFRGGLNLRGNDQTLAPNEVPYAINVDFDDRGGFSSRRGIVPFSTTASTTPLLIGWYETSTVTPAQVFVEVSGTIRYTTGTTYTDSTKTRAGVRMAVLNNLAFFCSSGTTANIKFDGTTFTDMVETYTSFDAAGTDDMAPSKVIAAWNNHMWIGNTYESSVRKGSRLRWSHPGKPDAWRTEDFVDVDLGNGGDDITALVPMGDALYIFKRNSCYTMHGDSWENFYLTPLSNIVGSPQQEATCVLGNTVFFFSWESGVWIYNKKGLQNVFQSLQPLLTLAQIDVASDVRLNAANNRLWLSVLIAGVRQTFVMDLTTQAWTQYTLPINSMTTLRRRDGTIVALATLVSKNYVYKTDVQTQFQDDFGGGTLASVAASIKTNWLSGDNAAMRKRWRRPWLSVESDQDCDVRIQAYYDYDGQTVKRDVIFQVNRDTVAVWDTNGGVYGGVGEFHEFGRTSSMGLSHTLQLQLSVAAANISWTVDSITVPYFEKALK